MALITKARKVGRGLRHIQPVIKAMDAAASAGDSASARERCTALIRFLEKQQRAVGDALAELHRIDRELAARIKPAEG